MYLEENLSPAKIGEKIGMHENSVRYHLRKANVIRPAGWQNRKTPTIELVRLYNDELLSLKEIAKVTGMTKSAIRNRLARWGYERRSPMARGWADPKRRPKEHPSILDIAWVAGVYEGEGSVLPRHSNYGGTSPIVSLTQKDGWLCQRLVSLFGGTVRVYNGGVRKTPMNYWRLTGPRAVGFLMTIYKFLSPRRQQQIHDAFAKAGLIAAQAA